MHGVADEGMFLVHPGLALTGCLLVLGLILLPIFYRRRFLGTNMALAVWIAATGLAGAIAVSRLMDERVVHAQSQALSLLSAVAAGAIGLFIVPLLVHCVALWTGRVPAEPASRPGRGREFLLLLLVSVSALFGMPRQWLWITLAAIALVCVEPIHRLLRSSPSASQPPGPAPDTSAERQRVLRLLEEQKITSEDAGELLNALAESARPQTAPVVTSGARKLMVLGAVIVLVGFFLPWASINVDREMGRLGLSGWQGEGPFAAQGMPGQFHPPVVRVSGGDIGKGLGWVVLLLAIGAAVLPYVATGLPSRARRAITWLALGGGGVIIVYLFSESVRYVAFGLAVVAAGYIVEAVGAWKEQRLGLTRQ